MGVALIDDLYAYHRWANHVLFDTAVARGEAVTERDLGPHWSFSTIRRMFAHIYGADSIWLTRWKGSSPTAMPGGDMASMAELRKRWDALEAEQRAFVDALAPEDLTRVVDYKNTSGRAFHAPLALLLQHVPNHATHHRSEIAAMLTVAGGSPPDTGINSFILATTGQG